MLVRDPVIDTAICIWFFLFGSCIGSFLNVAVYRLPRKKSLSLPPSFCPNCGHFIRWYDNIPVFGWLKLGGKCRDCRMPISIRYPLIEAAVGLLFCGVCATIMHVLPDSSILTLSILTLIVAGLLTTILGVIFTCISSKDVLQ